MAERVLNFGAYGGPLDRGNPRYRQRGFSYLAKVTTGVRFKDSIEVNTADQAAS